MSTKEFLVNIALLVLILLFGWLTFNLEEPVHEPADIEALTARTPEPATPEPTPVPEEETSYDGVGPMPAPLTPAPAGSRADLVRSRYPRFDAHDVFETLIPTPPPPPTPVEVAPPVPPLKEALRGRWAFSYAMGGALNQAQWTDNTTQQQFVVKLGETTQFQYGKFNYTVRLDRINEDEFAAHLRTIHVTVDNFQIPEDELRNDDQLAVYSLFHAELNP